MNNIDELLAELTTRLPELEWKINSFSPLIRSQSLPRGLFRSGPELTGMSCIEEIKADIHVLSQQKSKNSAQYVATKIRQKVDVLVTLCQMESRKNKKEEKVHFGIKVLSTRQQWITTLEQDIKTLESQQQAMIKTLGQMQRASNITAVLSLQAELGEIEKRLTLARETLNQAIR